MHPTIPVELYRSIVDQIVHKSTLLCLLVTSKALSREAEQRFYFTVNCSEDNVFEFMAAILGCQRLAGYVHSFSFHGEDCMPDENYEPIAHGLRVLTNLRRLSFVACGCIPRAPVVLPLQNPIPFQLEYFDWDSAGDEEPLSAFLATQKHLTTIRLSWENNDLHVPQTALPQLRTLCGSLGTLMEFLPGRSNITALGWDSESDGATLLNVPSLSQIQFFSFGFPERPNISAIVSQLDSLEILEIFDPLIDELSTICTIPHLHTLVLSFENTDGPFPEFIIAADLFAGNKSLNRVDVAISSSQGQLEYERWNRAASGPRIIEPQEALSWKEWDTWNWTSFRWS